MYQLESAVAKTLDERGRWVHVDIGDMAFIEIYSRYIVVKAVLSNPFIDHLVCLDLNDVREGNSANAASLNQWLAALGTTTLPTSDEIPEIKDRFARYTDAVRAKYKITPIAPGDGTGVENQPSERTALHVTKEGLDFNLFRQYCMVSVNGYFHFADTGANSSLVMGGGKTRTVSNQAVMGVLSFKDIGSIESFPITPSMVYKQSDDQRYRHRVNLDVGRDISNKTVILVIGGYLHILDHKTFYRVGDNTLTIDFDNIHFLDRYHESLKWIDLSSLPVQRTDRNPTQVGTDDFLSDENILAYMTLPQSFVVLLDNPDVFVDRQYVRTSPMPHRLIAFTDPIYPLVNGLGKLAEYWTTYEDKQWSLTTLDNWKHNRLYHTVDLEEVISTGDQRVPFTPVGFSDACFLKIGTNK